MSELNHTPSIVKVNHSKLDEAHHHLASYAFALNSASDDEFPSRYLSLLGQLEKHFADEEALMQEHAFRHTEEHMEDHRQLLQEVRQLLQRRLPFARAYVSDRLPERLNLHISRMDSMLAAALNLG
jgi:hemerythrin-like metal-binding protein